MSIGNLPKCTLHILKINFSWDIPTCRLENIHRPLKEHSDLKRVFRFKHSKLADRVTFVSCIRKVNGWNLSERTNCSPKDFRGYPLLLQANVGLAPQATTYFGTSFPVSSWQTIALFDAVSSQVLTAS